MPETKVLIEQKGANKKLDEKITQSGGEELTAYAQAFRYNAYLPYDERARWIITSNFDEIWIYDLNACDPKTKRQVAPEDTLTKIQLEELREKAHLLNILVKPDVKELSKEVRISKAAGGMH